MINPISFSNFILKNNSLKSLDVSDCTINFTDELETAIIKNNSLKQLNFSECRLGDRNGISICKILEKKDQILDLNISDNNLTDEFATELLKIQLKHNQRFLDLTQNEFSLNIREKLETKFLNSIKYLFIGFKIGKTRQSEPCDGTQMSSVFEN